jgi:drug/metabolite transporter (DMT)-like permease
LRPTGVALILGGNGPASLRETFTLMPQKLPRGLALIAIMALATVFASNHIAARVAFDHGLSVVTAVAVRSGVTALLVLLLLLATRTPLRLSRAVLAQLALIGVLILIQSVCIYSAVARIPVALALLTFNTFPLVYTVLSWPINGRRPPTGTPAAMVGALFGLTLALGVMQNWETFFAANSQMLPGVLFALGASLSFAAVMVLTDRWLLGVDGRLRSCVSMTIVALGAIAVAASGVTGTAWALPRDSTGWAALACLTLLYGFAITMMFVLFARLDLGSNSIALNFEPVAALTLGWLMLGQSVGWLQLVGMGVVLAAIVLLGLSRARQATRV